MTETKPRNTVGQVIPRGERRWLIRWFLGRDGPGKRRYGSRTIHGTKKDAQKALREKHSRQDRGIAAPSPSQIPKLSAFVELWKSSQSAAALRARTRTDYLEMLARHVTPALGHLRLDQVHAAEIEERVVGPI